MVPPPRPASDQWPRVGSLEYLFPLTPCFVTYGGTGSLVEDRMSESNCPICYAALDVRDVAPCWDCGADPAELSHLAEGRHKYAEFLIFDSPIVLCDFCQVDFGSYAAEYFGQSYRVRLGKGLTFVRDVADPQPSKDKYCANCGKRLAFLRFLACVRERGAASE